MSLNRLRHEIIFEPAKKINRLEIGRLMFYNRLVLVAKRGKGGSVRSPRKGGRDYARGKIYHSLYSPDRDNLVPDDWNSRLNPPTV